MPPKKAAAGGKKVDQKKVQKIVEDRTFGMKNKNKSKKVQKYINQVSSNVANKMQQKKGPEVEVKSKKQLAAEKAAELSQIFKPVVDKKVTNQIAHGVDPKSVLCQFFKAGTCTKGGRCKFSHDLSIERKSEKIDIYTDRRDATNPEDNMENWDENKLREVVQKKGNKCQTEIICRFFLEAIETKKYGFFWECPNGGNQCHYRHALPPGYVFQTKKKKEEEEDEEDKPSLEDQLEDQRRALKTSTPLTLELFLKWKEDKRLAREKVAEERKKEIKAGKAIMSGREVFDFNPDMATGFDDDEAYDDSELRQRKVETEKEEEAEETTTTTTTTTTTSVQVDESVFAEEDVEDLPEFDD